MLIDQEGVSTLYPLSECYLKMDGQLGKEVFDITAPEDFVTFFGSETRGLDLETTYHPVYILIRNGRVVAVHNISLGVIFD